VQTVRVTLPERLADEPEAVQEHADALAPAGAVGGGDHHLAAEEDDQVSS
jgi:hypothetical protein